MPKMLLNWLRAAGIYPVPHRTTAMVSLKGAKPGSPMPSADFPVQTFRATSSPPKRGAAENSHIGQATASGVKPHAQIRTARKEADWVHPVTTWDYLVSAYGIRARASASRTARNHARHCSTCGRRTLDTMVRIIYMLSANEGLSLFIGRNRDLREMNKTSDLRNRHVPLQENTSNSW